MSFSKATDLLRVAEMAMSRFDGIALQDITSEFGCDHRTAQRMMRAFEAVFPQVDISDDAERRRRWHIPRHDPRWLQAQGSDRLQLELGRFDAINLRDSSDYQDMRPVQGGARNVVVSGKQDSDAFDFAGATWTVRDATKLSYHYGELQSIYRQHYLVFNHSQPLGNGTLALNLRYADSSDAGRSNIDNHMSSATLSWQAGMHKFTSSYQQMEGHTGFAYLSGTDPFLTHLVQINDFANRDERSWQLRHDLSFANLGLPGLKLMNRYTHGSNIEVANSRHNEWERNSDVMYTVQSGPLQNLSLHWRNATYRSTFGSDIDENRVIIGYTFSL